MMRFSSRLIPVFFVAALGAGCAQSNTPTVQVASPEGPFTAQVNVLNVSKSQKGELVRKRFVGEFETLADCRESGVKVYHDAVAKNESGTMGMVCVGPKGQRIYYEMTNGRLRGPL